jgi:predicted aspartyl protease
MLYTFDYDRSYVPPMPVAKVEIWYAPAKSRVNVDAIIDSGADATIVPQRYLERTGVRIHDRVWMRGMMSARSEVALYSLSLRVGSYVQGELSVVADPEGDEMVLGRDVLNHLQVTLNGIAGAVEIVG